MDAWGLSVCPVALPIPTQLVDLTTMEYNNEKQLLRFTVRVEHLRELPRIRLEALEHDLLEVHGARWLLPHTQRKEPPVLRRRLAIGNLRSKIARWIYDDGSR